MRTAAKLLVTLALILSIMLCAAAIPAPANNGAQAFAKLKELAGKWELQASGAVKGSSTIDVTSNGSAVMERFMVSNGDKREEMTTMFYLDGDQVKLTHYCAAGNQPTMVGTYSPETNTLTFDFVGATNLKGPSDGHMHHAVVKFVDKDHYRETWTFRKDQKDALTEELTYVRAR